MRYILTILCCLCILSAKAQGEDGEEPLVARVLALDTNVSIAKRFCEAIGSMAQGYNLAFIDNETRYAVRYVYKNPKNETLRLDYRFVMEGSGEDHTGPKHAVVTIQKISGELGIITQIYNYLFGATLTPERVMTSSTQGSAVKYDRGKTCDFSFLPDDYEPGYWVMTFVR